MRINVLLFSLVLIISTISCDSNLKLQSIDYTEFAGDIPNIDRGFYRPQSYVVPISSEEVPDLPDFKTVIAGTTVPVDARIIYMEYDLKNFSSNSPLDGLPAGPWGSTKPIYGKTQPLTSEALDYIRAALQQVRDSESVAIVKFSYDGRGFTYNNRNGYNQFIHDCEPGAKQGRSWYESGGINGGIEEDSDLCGITGHEDKNWVQYHLWQLGDVFAEFVDIIMCVKGGFFGPWGEMHSSSYSRSAEGYNWLLNALLDYVPESRSILVHAGGVMAWYNVEYGTNHSFSNLMPAPELGSPAQRFGMFNDSYSRGGDDFTDGGSLSEGSRLIGGDYDRNSALTWVRNQNNFYGGETVRSGNETDNPYQLYPRFPNVPYEAVYARTTHLNTSYSSAAYVLWNDFEYTEENVTNPFTPQHDGVTRIAKFDPLYDGKNGMEFMRDRLGYRLVIRESKISETVRDKSTLELELKIQNVGFGLIVNKKNVSIILKSKSDAQLYKAITNIDARDWKPDDKGNNRSDNVSSWKKIQISVDMNDFGSVPEGEYEVYLKINDPNELTTNKRSIRFANNGKIWDDSIGANLIGVTIIK